MKRLISLLTALLLTLPAAGALPGSSAAPTVDAEGIELVDQFEYGRLDPWETNAQETSPFFDSGTDLSFDGDYVYAAEQDDSKLSGGGVHIIDVSDPDEPQKVGFVACPGYQNDVAVVRPGIIALAYHSRSQWADESICDADPTDIKDEGAVIGGVVLFDVSDVENPVRLGTSLPLPGGTHTLTVSPDGNYIYASPGGIRNGGGTQQILDVSDPTARPFPAFTFQPNDAGCHDFEFFTSADDVPMGVCVGLTESQIWDLSDPTAPSTVSHIVNPLIQFHHSGIVTDDGRFLVIGDEAIGANDCAGGPTGAMFAYDISDPSLPVPRGYFGIDRAYGDQVLNASASGSLPPVASGPLWDYGRASWCTAHLYNFIPGTSIMVASWYSGGVNIIDWGEDFLSPREVAHYRTDGDYAEREVTNYWSGYWHEGRIYANDRVRGLDVLRWTEAEDVLGDLSEASPEDLTAAVRAMPATGRSVSGVLSDTLTPAQQRLVAQRPDLSSLDLSDALSPLSCRLVLLD